MSCAKTLKVDVEEPVVRDQVRTQSAPPKVSGLERCGSDLINTGEANGRVLSIKSFAKHMHNSQVNEYIRLEDIRYAEGLSIDPPLQIMQLANASLEAKEEEPIVPSKPIIKNKFRLTLDIDNDSKWLDPVRLMKCNRSIS